MNSKMVEEPPYHNRKHFIDVCISLTMLCMSESLFQDGLRNHVQWSLSTQQKGLLLLCAVGHDFGHQGLINQFPFQIISVRLKTMQNQLLSIVLIIFILSTRLKGA